MAGFEAWRAGEAQSARPAASPTPERPHSCTCWGKHLNGNNVKFHSYLMSSDLTGPRGKDRSKIIVLDKFLREKKSNRQTFRDDVCGMKKEKARKSVAARPAQRQPEPARWLFVCLVIHLLCTGLSVWLVLYLIHTEIKFHPNSPRTWEEKFIEGEQKGGNKYSEIFNQFETAFPDLERK